ncbi:MAG: nucleoside triphosphate pyrophosphohydrolase [Bacteroides sp.]|nr:nucleoside triphosphate pyrophosphohydrolase [Eubacterium sp.]MCM1417246.1 nucleoside triphosphate pyrophosphohydrolase [Roseburia sp.]MCM1461134.1 nucleoside triphosphate pyrophosphohydrolase [Bacteroides sp.]
MFKMKEKYTVDDLREIMKELRSDHGCPWDREQDHHSIRKDVLEEAYEVAEAIDSDDPDLLKEELGDLLLQVIFHSELEAEKGVFDLDDVADGICKKLIYRHPHVFGSVRVSDSDEVLRNWDSLKSKSKEEKSVTDRLNSVPKLLPALMRGEKVWKRATNAGHDYPDAGEIIATVKGGIASLESAVLEENDIKTEEELGNILFYCTNLARFLKKDSEKALTFAINRFIIQFSQVETLAEKEGRFFSDLSQSELRDFWETVRDSSI